MIKTVIRSTHFAVLAVAALLTSIAILVAPATALAADDSNDEYTYTVRIFSGNQGTIGGEPVRVVTGLHAGDRFTFYSTDVAVANDSKYYVRGLRESGRDNNTSIVAPSFLVTEDTDYVVAYGIRGQDVEYTVRYVDTDGNSLAPDAQFWGNVGDSPVIPALYFEGYQPQAYNLTGELYEDPSDNIYTFVYTALAEGVEQPQPEGDATATVTPAAPADQAIDDNDNPLAAPEDVIDIRDDENPLAGPFGSLLEGSQILRNAWAYIIGSVALAAIVLAVIILAVKRRKKDQADGVRY